MGLYLNPGNVGFEEIRRDIYVDKTGLIGYMNSLIGKPKPLVCFSRPRRFGKSFDASMLCAYYDRSCDSHALFDGLEISETKEYEAHLNKYNVLSFDMTGFIHISGDRKVSPVERLQSALIRELRETYPECMRPEEDDLGRVLYNIVSEQNIKFIFVIDEWDALFREFKDDKQLQTDYILFLRNLFKNRDLTPKIIAAAYMTGILPIKKYGTESALSDFREFSMTGPAKMARYVGFTEDEVKKLCLNHGMNFDDMKSWYDGYSFRQAPHVYSPNSVINAIQNEEIQNYWTKTETFESLKQYIDRDFDGLKNDVILMLAGQHVKVDTGTFQNDITSFSNKDDILTLLIHLGYLAYDQRQSEVYIPNREVSDAFQAAVKGGKWQPVEQAIKQSDRLLQATIDGDSSAVAETLELVHEECSSVLTYNDENSLACSIYIAYYTARNDYMLIREFPAGKGFTDYVFLPRRDVDKPAMIVELKYDRGADTAICQIHNNRYEGILRDYAGELLLVGVSYFKDARGKNAKRHECVIERR